MHLGNARTALFAWLRARVQGGAFVMRVEDLDRERSRPEAVLGNLAELGWLGLDWDEGPDVGGPHAPYLQSERSELYAEALERLRAKGLLFESYLSRREIAELGDPADEGVYGAGQRLAESALRASGGTAGRTPSLRLRVPAEVLAFDDLLAGRVSIDLATEVGDFVLRRADTQHTYQLAVVVDDAAMAITEVVRGADLLSSTAAQLLLYRALELRPPAFAHVGLLLGPDGEKLSKRHGPTSLRELEAAGLRPERVLGLLAHSLGWLAQRREIGANELLELGPTGTRGPAPAAPLAPAGAKPSAVQQASTPAALAAPHALTSDDLAWLHA